MHISPLNWQHIAINSSPCVRSRYAAGVLLTYQEVRDRIYVLARTHNLRVDWSESGRARRTVWLYDSRQMVAKGSVPLRYVDVPALLQLSEDLEHVFGEGWLE